MFWTDQISAAGVGLFDPEVNSKEEIGQNFHLVFYCVHQTAFHYFVVDGFRHKVES